MKISEITSLVIVTDALAIKFLKLDEEGLTDALRGVYDEAVKDSRYDDSKFCAGLDGETLEEYAALVDTFQRMFRPVKNLKDNIGEAVFIKESIPVFATLAACCHVLSTFRKMNSRTNE